MVWAVDLDDGTLIKALGSNMQRKKSVLLDDVPNPIPHLDPIAPHDEL
jgi:chitinase